MHTLDIILLIPLLWGLIRGFIKGLIIELSSLIAFILGVYGGIEFSDMLGRYLSQTYGWHTPYLSMIAFTIIFVGVILLIRLLAKLIEKLIKAMALGMVNRLLGALFGVLKYAFLLSVILFLVNAINQDVEIIPAKTRQASVLYSPISKISPLVIPALKNSRINDLIKDETDSLKAKTF